MIEPDNKALKVHGALLERSEIARMLKGALATLGIAAAAGAVVSVSYGDSNGMTASFSMLVVIPLLLWLLSVRREALAALGTAQLLLLVAVFLVTHGEGLFDVAMLIFPGVIVIGALLLEQRFSTLNSALAVLCAAAVGVAHAEGWLDIYADQRASLRDVLHATIVLTALAILVRMLTSALYRGLHRAYTTEQTRIEIFNAVAEGLAIFDADSGRLIDINDAARKMWGLSPQAALECDLGLLAPADVAGADKISTVLREIPPEAGYILDWERTSDNGRPVQAEVTLKRVTLGGQPRIIAVSRDVTEHNALREQVRQSEKLRAIGQLAGGIAHDFNNQLTGIMASASILELELKDPKMLGHAQMILRCSTRSADLTRELLTFSRQGKTPYRPVDCHALIEEVVALLRRSIDKRIVIEQRLAAEPFYTLGDASLLENAVLNLALNARDAMPHGGHLCIQTRALQVNPGPRRVTALAALPAGEYVEISVSDTGVGIDPQTQARIFEPFFTTKPAGHGLGLAAVYGTLQAHGGVVTVHSAVGVGTTFTLYLPRSAEAADKDRDSVVTGIARASSEELRGVRVLLADDEADVAEVVAITLRQAGATVEVCTDGRSALHKFKESPEAFDLVILDQMMPELSGVQAMALIRAQHPGAVVLIISGYTGEEDQAAFFGANEFLHKPFSAGDLQAIVRRMLRRKLRRAGS